VNPWLEVCYLVPCSFFSRTAAQSVCLVHFLVAQMRSLCALFIFWSHSCAVCVPCSFLVAQLRSVCALFIFKSHSCAVCVPFSFFSRTAAQCVCLVHFLVAQLRNLCAGVGISMRSACMIRHQGSEPLSSIPSILQYFLLRVKTETIKGLHQNFRELSRSV
jgi:hypothetical protein